MIGELAALCAPACFAIAAVIYRNPLKETRAASASIVRFTGTGFLLIAVLILVWGATPILMLPTIAILLAVLSGITGLGLGDVLYMTSFKDIGVARTVSLVATYPMFSIVLDLFVRQQMVPIVAILGALLIFLGIWMLTRSDDIDQELIPSSILKRGSIAALCVAFFYSVSMILIDEALSYLGTSEMAGAFAVNALRTSSGGAFLLMFSPIIDREFSFLRMNKRNAGLLLIGSIIAYGIGWYLLTFAFILAPASSVVPLSSTTPLFAAVLAVTILHESLKKKGALGIVLIVLGILLVVGG